MMDPGSPTASRPGQHGDPEYDRAFFGHPRGLATLFFTELWERFSYYGMRALLILFMVAPVSTGGLGFAVAEASAIYGIYTALAYMAALPGGWFADRIVGQRNAVLIGGIIIASGHVCLAIHGLPFFYGGMALIILGTGLLKPNISTMVGSLYGEGDHRRDGGFSVFYMGINLGAFLAPLVCGYLAQNASFRALLESRGLNPNDAWHWGFGAAAVGMALGLVQYVYGLNYLGEVGKPPPAGDPEARSARRLFAGFTGVCVITVVAVWILNARGMLQISVEGVTMLLGRALLVLPLGYFAWILLKGGFEKAERKRMTVIFILFFFSALFWSAFEQAGSSLNLFADRFTRNSAFGWDFPSSWFQSVNSVFIIGLAPVFAWLWVRLGDREPSSPAKFAFGLFFVGIGFLVVAAAAWFSGPEGARVGPGWLVGVFAVHTVGELCLSPVGLSMVTKLAPARAVGQMMGVWFMSIALGNFLGGQIAGYFEKLPLPQLFGAIFLTTTAAALLLAAMVPSIRRLMGGIQ